MLLSAFKWLLFITWALVISMPSHAQSISNWYLGAGLGRGEAEVIGHERSPLVFQNLARAELQPTVVTGSEQDNTNNWKLYAGYRVKPWLAAELSYHDLGHTTGLFTASLNGIATNVQGTLRSEYQAVAIAIVGEWQVLKQLSLFAKGGLHFWEHQFDIKGGVADISNTRHGNGPLYGAGVKASLWSAASLKLEWERLFDIEDEEGIDIKTVSLEWAF